MTSHVKARALKLVQKDVMTAKMDGPLARRKDALVSFNVLILCSYNVI